MYFKGVNWLGALLWLALALAGFLTVCQEMNTLPRRKRPERAKGLKLPIAICYKGACVGLHLKEAERSGSKVITGGGDESKIPLPGGNSTVAYESCFRFGVLGRLLKWVLISSSMYEMSSSMAFRTARDPLRALRACEGADEESDRYEP